MGLIQHHAIIATCGLKEHVTAANRWIKRLPKDQRDRFVVTPPTMNSYQSIILPSDGSKEGWADSDRGDELREKFKTFIKSRDYEDGSNPFDWVEVAYGECGTEVASTNCVDRY